MRPVYACILISFTIILILILAVIVPLTTTTSGNSLTTDDNRPIATANPTVFSSPELAPTSVPSSSPPDSVWPDENSSFDTAAGDNNEGQLGANALGEPTTAETDQGQVSPVANGFEPSMSPEPSDSPSIPIGEVVITATQSPSPHTGRDPVGPVASQPPPAEIGDEEIIGGQGPFVVSASSTPEEIEWGVDASVEPIMTTEEGDGQGGDFFTSSEPNETMEDGELGLAASSEVDPVEAAQEEGSDQALGHSHVAHAVPGTEYKVYDLDGDGVEEVALDGSRSHSHYYDPGPPPQLAEIVSWVWYGVGGEGKLLAEVSTPFLLFKLGKTRVQLRVEDSAGNSHEEITTVTVLPSRREGVYCYYYEGVGENGGWDIEWNMALGKKPLYGEEMTSIDFSSAKDFPVRYQDKSFQMRCSFSLENPEERPAKFSIQHYGPMQMLIDIPGGHEVIMEKLDQGLHLTTTVYNLPRGVQFLQVMYVREAEYPAVLKLVKMPAVPLHDLARQLPVIHQLSPSNSTLQGGGLMKVIGSGFWNDPFVYINGDEYVLAPDFGRSSAEQIVVEIPSADEEKVVQITVGNQLGGSNAKNFVYAEDALEPVTFEQGQLMGMDGQPYKIKLITNLQYGPDHRLYLASLDSFVYSLGVNGQLEVTDECKSESLGYLRTVIGLAFNYAETELKLYVSSSIFYWEQSGLKGDFPWANGQISVLKPGHNGQCLGVVGDPIITGLPVSNHDHGVNNLLFDDDGLLIFPVGAATNAGVPAESIGGIDESPLSAAILYADIYKAGFNGKIVYDSRIPGESRKIAGDVNILAPGWRNAFDLTLHSNGYVYATDNGANSEFGNRSTSCEEGDLISPYHTDDKLGKVIRGKYGGHANRNRGRQDPSQCVWRHPYENATREYMPPIATFESSTDGLIEYTGDLFSGQLKGNLLASKYSTNDPNDNGRVYRVILNAEGGRKGEVDTLWEGSGLSIEMSPRGDVLMPRLYEANIMVLRAVYERKGDGRLISVMPFRGRVGGGNEVLVSVDGMGKGSTALFGGKACVKVRERKEGSFTCTVPMGMPGGVQVAISRADGVVVKSSGGVDYRYMRI